VTEQRDPRPVADGPTVLLCIGLVLAGVAVAMGTFNGVSLLAIIAAAAGAIWRWAAWERGR
jgi:hypothetical protein